MAEGSWFTPAERVGDAGGVPVPPRGNPQAGAPLPQRRDHGGAAVEPQHGDNTGGALVPRRGGYAEDDLVPQRVGQGATATLRDRRDVEPVAGWPEFAGWARRHQIVLAGLALIAVQLWWKARFLSHFFFWQDDYHLLARALDNSFNWQYLSYVGAGHLIPGPYVIAWGLARIALYDWALASAVTLALLACSCLALLRLLRNLFGDRPAILIPLAVYLFTPLTLPDLGWWSSAIESVPLQLATFMAIDAHVRYVRTGSYRHAAAAAMWLAVGMFFFEKGAVLPLLLFAVTSAFFADGRWPVAIRRSATAYWRAWLLYLAVLGAYIAVLAVRLPTSGVQPRTPGPYRNVLTFMSELVRNTFVPGALGGPWQWFPSGQIGYSAPPGALVTLSWVVAAVIVVVSIIGRRYAWRAWFILAGWILTADMAPVIIGRIRELSGGLLGTETRYVADAAPILAVCLGLAFLPVVGRRDSRRIRPAPQRLSQVLPTAAAAVVGAFVVGSLWSAQAYESVTTAAPARNFITNARAALRAMPAGTVIVDQQVPETVILGIFGPYSYASKVIGEMARADGRHLRWTQRPVGIIDRLMVFGQDGRLREAVVYGRGSPPHAPGKCWPARGSTIALPLAATRVNKPLTLRIAYFAWSAQHASVSYGGRTQVVTFTSGLHNAYLAVPRGGTGGLAITGISSKFLCVGGAAVGVPVPLNSGPAIPAAF